MATLGIVANPVHARAARAVDALLAHELAAGHPLPRLLHTTIAEPGGAQARRLVADGCRSIIAVGGDGTVREVAYAVAGGEIALGVVPTGTANLIGRNLGLPGDLPARVRLAIEGRPRPADLGIATLDDGPEQPFLAYAGIGEDAATVADTQAPWKARLGPLGWLAYLAAGARHLFRGASPMALAYDGGPWLEREAWCVLAGNVGRIPAGIRVFPGARVDDGLLHLVEVSGDAARWPLVAAEGMVGQAVPGSGLRRTAARTVEVRPATPEPVHLDGDVVGAAHRVRFAVRPGAVRIRRPGPD